MLVKIVGTCEKLKNWAYCLPHQEVIWILMQCVKLSCTENYTRRGHSVNLTSRAVGFRASGAAERSHAATAKKKRAGVSSAGRKAAKTCFGISVAHITHALHYAGFFSPSRTPKLQLGNWTACPPNFLCFTLECCLGHAGFCRHACVLSLCVIANLGAMSGVDQQK